VTAPRAVLQSLGGPAVAAGGAAGFAAMPSWSGAAVVLAGGVITVFTLLAPRWTSREARAGRLAGSLHEAGLPIPDVARIVDTALRRPPDRDERP
jgi:hypothetical protein